MFPSLQVIHSTVTTSHAIFIPPSLNKKIALAARKLHAELHRHNIPHELIVVDDGSTDRTWSLLQSLQERLPQLKPIQNTGLHGFGRAVICGLDHMAGDAVVIMMADASDD